MWWKIYFWVFTISSGLGAIIYLFKLTSWTPYDWVTFITAGAVFFVLYSYIYNNSTLTQFQWKIYFWVFVSSNVLAILIHFSPYDNILLVSNVSSNNVSFNEYIMSQLLSIPIFIACYKLGFTKTATKITKTSKKK